MIELTMGKRFWLKQTLRIFEASIEEKRQMTKNVHGVVLRSTAILRRGARDKMHGQPEASYEQHQRQRLHTCVVLWRYPEAPHACSGTQALRCEYSSSEG